MCCLVPPVNQAERVQLKAERAELKQSTERAQQEMKRNNDEAVAKLAKRVEKFKEAKQLQESILQEERTQLEDAAAALIAEKKAWRRKRRPH